MAEPARQFDFSRDTFAFRNELHWEYLLDNATGKVTTRKNDPPPAYAHRCFVVVRSARQFFFHASFKKNLPTCSDEEFARRIREVVRRSDWQASLDSDRIVFPGFNGLREFSEARPELLKANCGAAWQSYITRRHWRMLCPFSRGGQAREAARLAQEISIGETPIVHVLRFPQLTINHALLVFGVSKSGGDIEFKTYDPNLPQTPAELIFRGAARSFYLPRTIYWAGGVLNVYETYRKPLTPFWA